MNKQRVIVGGGHAAAQFCASMTELDPGAGLTLVSDEVGRKTDCTIDESALRIPVNSLSITARTAAVSSVD